MTPLRIVVLTVTALLAFAANSLLCRMALRGGAIDPASFTSIRLVAGAAALALIARTRARAPAPTPAHWLAATLLFVYAAAFSFAYLSLTTGTGALLLFGAVQVSMIGAGLWRGERLLRRQWLGGGLAVAGLIALVWPGLAAPPTGAAALMLISGIAWGMYSLRGRGAVDPVATTAANFLRAAPFALAVSVACIGQNHLDARGAALAVLSGAVTSAAGYVVWYTVLPWLSRANAGLAQLAVPPLAILAGAVLLHEVVDVRIVASSLAILGGVATAASVAARRE